MARTMTTSEMTDGQIEDLTNKFRDALRKCRDRIPSDIAQQAAGTDNLGMICATPYLAICEKFGGMVIRPVSVDYSRPLAEMIKAGHYDYANESITADNFPMTGEGQVELDLTLIHFNRGITSKEAITEMRKMGMRPATLPELLALGEKYPEEQRQYPIIAFGSVRQHPLGDRDVPYLGEWSGERGLSLSWFDNGWGDRCRFLAVRA